VIKLRGDKPKLTAAISILEESLQPFALRYGVVTHV
jgi:hypothetical protein